MTVNATMIGLVEASCRGLYDDGVSLEDNLRTAFTAARNNGIVTDKESQFQGAVLSVLLALGEDHKDYERIQNELKSLRVIATIMSGIMVGEHELEPPVNPVGLLKLWREVAET